MLAAPRGLRPSGGPVAVVPNGGDARERATPFAGVVGEAHPLDRACHHHDGHLVTHDHRFAAFRVNPSGLDRREHACLDATKCLAPTWLERVAQLNPSSRVAHRFLHSLALEPVMRFDHPLVGDDLQPEPHRPRRRRLLRPLKRACDQPSDGMPGQTRRRGIRHSMPEFAQVVAGNSSVQHAFWVMHFTVSNKMDKVSWHPPIVRAG